MPSLTALFNTQSYLKDTDINVDVGICNFYLPEVCRFKTNKVHFEYFNNTEPLS